MAARENQGYLIAVIVLVLLTLVLALVSFLGMSKASEYLEGKTTLEAKSRSLQNLSDAYFHQSEILKAMIGDLGPSIAEVQTNVDAINSLSSGDQKIGDILAQVQEIKEAYDSDMMGSTIPNEDGEPGKEPTYREKLRDMTELVAKKVSEYAIQVNQTNQAEKEAQTKISSMQKELTASNKAKKDAEDSLAETERLSLEKEQKLKDEVKGYTDQLQVENRKLEELRKKTSDDIDQLNRQLASVTEENTVIKQKLNEILKESFDNPDGAIVRVASPLRTVYIDLGMADGLKTNMTFGVYDQTTTNFDKGKTKLPSR